MRKSLSNIEFIEKAKNVHGNLYDYSLIDYLNNRIKVKIICKKHGQFEQTPKRHIIDKCGCKKCLSGHKRLSADEVFNRFKITHGETYDYSKVVFKTTKSKVEVICKNHGSFFIKPEVHFNGRGCAVCGCKSVGENMIRKMLTKKNIIFEEQKKFDDCRNILPLKYDFFIPSKNLLIEYDGSQHYKPSNKFGVVEFEKTKLRDKIKTKYAEINGISLIRIPYYSSNNIENILNII